MGHRPHATIWYGWKVEDPSDYLTEGQLEEGDSHGFYGDASNPDGWVVGVKVCQAGEWTSLCVTLSPGRSLDVDPPEIAFSPTPPGEPTFILVVWTG